MLANNVVKERKPPIYRRYLPVIKCVYFVLTSTKKAHKKIPLTLTSQGYNKKSVGIVSLHLPTSQPKNTNRYCPATICFYPPIVYLYFTPYSAGGPTSKLLRTDLIESIKTDLIDLIEALPGWSGLIVLHKDCKDSVICAFYNFQLVFQHNSRLYGWWLFGQCVWSDARVPKSLKQNFTTRKAR